MMKHWITAALAAAAAATAGTAGAADPSDESGFYLGGGVGEFQVDIDDFDDVPATIDDYDSDDTAYKLFGGFQANRWFGMELAYVNLGSPDDEITPGTTVEIETDGFAPYLVGTIPVGPFEFFGKAGYYFYDTKVTVDSGGVVSSGSDEDEAFSWTAGVGLTLMKTLNLRLEYEEFDVEDTDDTNALWLTAAFRF